MIFALVGLIPAAANDRLQNGSDNPAEDKAEAEISQRQVQINALRQEIGALLNELKTLEEKMRTSIGSKSAPALSTLDESIKSIEAARKEAVAWLSTTGRRDLIIGPIEKAGWVYVINIVAKDNPSELHNELLIRSLDNCGNPSSEAT